MNVLYKFVFFLRPKSVRNHCVIEVFGGVCVLSFGFRIFCWYRGFCHRTGSDLLLFLFFQADQKKKMAAPLLIPSFFFGPIEKQYGHSCLCLTETFSTSPLKPLNGFQRNLTGSKRKGSKSPLPSWWFSGNRKNKMAYSLLIG